MDTTGDSTSGSSRTARRDQARKPRITSSRLRTVAKTGRFTEISEILMTVFPVPPAAWRPEPRLHPEPPPRLDAHPRAFTQLLRAFRDHEVTLRETLQHLHVAHATLPEAQAALRHGVVLDQEHVYV